MDIRNALWKLEEAAYHLQCAARLPPVSDEFRFVYSAFLTAAQSVEYCLLENLNRHWGLALQHVSEEKLRKACKAKGIDAFLLDKVKTHKSVMLQSRSGGLFRKRHENVHKELINPTITVSGELTFGGTAFHVDIGSAVFTGADKANVYEGPPGTAPDPSKKIGEVPISSKVHFADMEEDARLLGWELLGQLHAMVDDVAKSADDRIHA